jgi:3'-phosphoadenosine 5'-phosphosulfate sulfotransferase (PAPS reductase)/FAD synthetase
MWTDDERDLWRQHAAKNQWQLTMFPFDKWGDERTARAVSESEHRNAVHRQMFAGVTAYAHDHSLTTRVMGIRADESKGRRASLSTHGPHHTYPDGTHRLCPIDLWSAMDCFAYCDAHSLPVLDIYRKVGRHARSGLIGRNGEAHGRMSYLRRHFPAAWRHARDVLGLEYARNT